MNLDFTYPNENLAQIVALQSDFLNQHNIKLFVKTDYLIHPQIAGNKWRKLKYNLDFAKKTNKKTLLTFGGAFSNHIYATAAAGKVFGFDTIGIIRGEEIKELNLTLDFAQNTCGMKLIFVDRATYKIFTQEKNYTNLSKIIENYKPESILILPEGGTNELAIKGCEEIVSQQDFKKFDFICTCVGTGGTTVGIIQSSQNQSHIIGFSCLKGDFLKHDVANLISQSNAKNYTNWEIITDYHFGGYAKKTSELNQFISDFELQFQMPVEFVYTGKMFFGIFDLIKKGYFKPNTSILAIHSGGLRV